MPDARAVEAAPTLATKSQTRLSPLDALRRLWGYNAFRPAQAEAVQCALTNQDALVVLPTGGGKSLCYQVPAACGSGLVLVISPLIALMDDQVAAAREVGLAAGALHTNIAEAERRRLRDAAMAGSLQLLYVSPERLVAGDLMFLVRSRLSLIAVDEAHCVSHWGHDFRPEYRQLKPLLEQAPNVPRMALTATATPQVQDDICAQLGLREPKRMIGHVDRPNLIYRATSRQSGTKQVLAVIKRHPDEGGIVYAQTRRDVERLSEALIKAGVRGAAYHAGLPGDVRATVQDDFVNERLDVVVATIAFGMGIDRSNVRYVVHANTPKSIEHYQQESGRAGRDGLPAECVLFYSASDLAMHRRLANSDGPLPPERAKTLDQQLREIGRFAVSPLCRHRLLAEHFGQPYPPPDAPSPGETCGACDVCLGEVEALPADEAVLAAQKIISAVWRSGGRFGAAHVVDMLRGEKTDKVLRAGHDQLALFGLLREHTEANLRTWIDQLVVQGLLCTVDEDIYSFLDMTESGRKFCKTGGEIRLGRLVAVPAKAKRAAAVEKDLPAMDKPLFDRLRDLRKRVAQKLHVPPYVVFNDVTLRELAAQRPTTLTAMRAVKGVGDAKLQHYGSLFLAVIGGAEIDPSMELHLA